MELNTDGKDEIRQSGENKAEDLPGSFAGNLRVIAEDDASAFEFLLTPSAFHAVFLSCVSVSVYSSFVSFALFSKRTYALSRSVSFFVVLGRYWWGKGSLLVWDLTRKLRNPSGLFVFVFGSFVSFSSKNPLFSSPVFGLFVPLCFLLFFSGFCLPFSPVLGPQFFFFSFLARSPLLSLYRASGSLGGGNCCPPPPLNTP